MDGIGRHRGVRDINPFDIEVFNTETKFNMGTIRQFRSVVADGDDDLSVDRIIRTVPIDTGIYSEDTLDDNVFPARSALDIQGILAGIDDRVRIAAVGKPEIVTVFSLAADEKIVTRPTRQLVVPLATVQDVVRRPAGQFVPLITAGHERPLVPRLGLQGWCARLDVPVIRALRYIQPGPAPSPPASGRPGNYQSRGFTPSSGDSE